MGDVAVDVGQPEVAAGVFVGQRLVIEPQQMEDRRVQIVEVHAVFHCGDAVLVGGAVGHAALHAAAGHPEAEAGGVVVAPVVLLDVWRAAKLAAPDDESLVEQSAFLQIL